ncbi:MAG: LytR/AlgR family response regulator transcription factor [Clostridia bacterium]
MSSILILEDEHYTRRLIRKMVSENVTAFQIFDTSKHSEAVDFAKEHSPDIALLDIELEAGEKVNGLDVAKSISMTSPKTKFVFITGYPKYALDAFSVHPYDYILKPIDIKKMIETISVLAKEVEKEKSIQKEIDKIIIHDGNEFAFVTLEDILFIEKQNKNSLVYTQENMYTTQQTLSELEQALPEYFIRVHKSFVVNKNKIHIIREVGNRSYEISFLKNKKVAFMSKNRFKELKEKIIPS